MCLALENAIAGAVESCRHSHRVSGNKAASARPDTSSPTTPESDNNIPLSQVIARGQEHGAAYWTGRALQARPGRNGAAASRFPLRLAPLQLPEDERVPPALLGDT
jgi:hypothetical protein